MSGYVKSKGFSHKLVYFTLAKRSNLKEKLCAFYSANCNVFKFIMCTCSFCTACLQKV